MVASRTKAAKLPIQESSGRGVKRSAESTAGQLSLHSFLRPSSSATNVQESVRTARGGPTEPEPAGSARPSTPSLGSGNAVTFAAAAASDPKDAQEESSSPFTSLLGEKSSSSFTNSSEAKSPGPSTNLAARSSLSSTATTTSPGPAPMSPVPAAGLGRSATATATATTTATAMATTSRGNPSRGGGRLSLGELYQKNVSSAAGPSSARSSRGKGLFGQEVQSALAALRVADSIPEEPSEGSRGVPESLRRASEEGGEEAKLRNSEGGGGGGGGNAESGEPEHEKKKNTSSGAEGAGSREQVEQTKTSGPKTNPLQAASPLRSTRRRLSTKGPPQARCATPKGTPRSRKRATATTTTTTTTTTATTTSSSRAASKKAQKQGENAEESHAQAQQGGADVEESASDPCAKTSDEPLNAATATPNTTTATAATATATATARAAESAEAKSAVNDSVTQGSEKRKQSRRALGAPAPSKRSRKKPLPTEAQAEENKENETDNSSNKIKGSDTHNNNSSNNNSNKINLTDGNGNDPSKRKLQDCKITEDNPKPSTADVAEFGNDNGGNTDSLEDAQTPRPPPRKHAKETKPSRPAASEEKKGPPTIEPTLNSAEPEREEPQSKESLGSASSGRLTLRERLARRTSIPGGSRPSEAAQEEGQNSTEADTDASSGQDHKKLGGLTLQWRLMFEGNRHPSRSELGADEPSKPKEAKPAPVSPLMPRAFNSTPTTSRSKSPTKTEDVASARGALADRGTSPTVRTPPSHESFQGGPSKADSRRASRGSPTTDETTSFYPDMTHATSSELKAALLARGVGLAGCVEKADLLALWRKMIESPSKEKDPEPFLSRGRLSSSDLSSSVGNRRRVSVSGAPPDHGTTSPFLCHAQTSTFSSNSNSSNNNNSSNSSNNNSSSYGNSSNVVQTPPAPSRIVTNRTSPNDESEPTPQMSFKEVREMEARKEVTRILALRQEMFPNLCSWGHEVLKLTRKENAATGGAAAHKCYRSLMKQLHPDKVEQTPMVSKAVDLVREARDAVERSMLRKQPPGKPRNLRSEVLCNKFGQRRFKLAWKAPPELPDSPVSRYVVAVVDPSFGRALAVATLEADYSPELGRFLPIEERTSFVLEEQELVKMPRVWQQAKATIQVAAGNDAGQSGWSILQVPLTC